MSPKFLNGLTRCYLLALLATMVLPAYAQADGSVESIMTTTIASFALIIITILVVMIYRKVSQRRRDNTFDSAGLDLMRLRNKGLLTPEEMEKVSRSIARRMEEQEAARKKAATRPTPESLLLDPEVRRLQTLSEARDRGEADRTKRSLETLEDRERQAELLRQNAQNELEANSPSEFAVENTIEEEEIILPPEVQQLADAGVLTAEEIENVKRRLRAKKDASG